MSNVTVLTGDLFASGAQTLTNAVNTIGVMGRGIALEFKKRYPDMFADYVERCGERTVELGVPYLYRGPTTPWILNFPTKDHWRSPSRLDDIASGLDHLTENAETWGIRSIAVPALGCGAGGLDWSDVGPLLHDRLSRMDIPVELYAPTNAAAAELVAAGKIGKP